MKRDSLQAIYISLPFHFGIYRFIFMLIPWRDEKRNDKMRIASLADGNATESDSSYQEGRWAGGNCFCEPLGTKERHKKNPLGEASYKNRTKQ